MGMEAPSQPQTERLKLASAQMMCKLLDQDFVYVQRKAERERGDSSVRQISAIYSSRGFMGCTWSGVE